jgi:hypothetical protein
MELKRIMNLKITKEKTMKKVQLLTIFAFVLSLSVFQVPSALAGEHGGTAVKEHGGKEHGGEAVTHKGEGVEKAKEKGGKAHGEHKDGTKEHGGKEHGGAEF